MESQPQNPEFRNNPENFHPCNILSSPGKDNQDEGGKISPLRASQRGLACPQGQAVQVAR